MMAGTSFPVGVRFHPTDVELVKYYLKRKVMGKKVEPKLISELNIYKYSPWDLPDKSCLRSKDLEWYFFCPKETKFANGARWKRATECGYWKSTGNDRHILYNDQTAGMVKTLVFHKGHAPKGERTDWVMYEYRILDKELADAGVVQDAYVLCKVFQKSGPGPKNGAQYGAPFNEDDYDDDGEICSESLPAVALPSPALLSNKSVFLPGSSSNGPLSDSVFEPGSTSAGPLSDSVFELGSTSAGPLSDSGFVPGSTSSGPFLDPGLSNAMPSADEVPQPLPDSSDDLNSILNRFIPVENGNNEVENSGHVKHNDSDVNDIYIGLEDLNDDGAGFSLSNHHTTGLNPMLAGNHLEFLELDDLDDDLWGTLLMIYGEP